MRVREQFRDGMLTLAIDERALVKRPDWEQIAGLKRADTVVVAVNLAQVDFVSSLFLQGCAELSRALVERGGRVALLHLSPAQKVLLDMVDGASGLLTAEDEEQLRAVLGSRVPAAAARQDEGVTEMERNSLWG